jgi:tetratricopeptide (TPR) repeat protein
MLTFLLIASVNGQNAKKFFRTGEDFYKTGNYKDAINQFTNAISVNPAFTDAYINRGKAYNISKNFDKAVDDFNRAITFEPQNEEIYYCRGVSYNNLNKFKEALDDLNHATFLNKKFIPAYQEKIISLMALDQNYGALKVSDTTLALESSALNYYLNGLVTQKLNSTQKAEYAFTKAIKEDKKYIDAYIALAMLQINFLNKTDEAMAHCNEALKIDPNSKSALIARSKVYIKKLDFRNAIDDLSKAIIINPENEELFLLRGNYYQDFKQHQNAIDDFNKVINLNPKNAEALYKRANSYEEISDFNGAIKDYQTLVQLSEYDVKAQQLLKKSRERLYELKRESNNPVITILDPAPKDKSVFEIPNNKHIIQIKGFVTDESDLSFIRINNKDIPYKKVNGQNEFVTDINLDSLESIFISSSDVYNNVEKINFNIIRTETNPPKVSIIAPLASDNGEIFLDNNDPVLYVEGKITDESPVKSIIIDDVSASFPIDQLNPKFSANINISNKNNFTVTATDIYGNGIPVTFKINRENISLFGSNPMGKTWVVFIENSNYRTFASLEGPTKDVTLMKTALAKYQVNNFVHKKDLTKEQMEKFFSIDLRDLVKSNRVNTLLIWYAGHGKYINETGYWIPIDANRDDEFTYFNINFLRASLQSYSTVTHKLVISDACESGPTFFQAMRSTLKERSCDDWQATRLKSSQVYSSAGYELAQDYSQFTKTIATLLANNPNACIPIESIVLKVNSSLSQDNQQKPKFGKISGLSDEDGTFFFIAKEKK